MRSNLLLELLHLVHRNVLIHQLVYLFIHLHRKLPPGNPTETNHQEDNEDYYWNHSEDDPASYISTSDWILTATLRHRCHAFADSLKYLIRFEVATVDHTVDNDTRVVEDGVVVLKLRKSTKEGVIIIFEWLVYLCWDCAVFEIKGGQDPAWTLIIGGEVITRIIKTKHIIPPFTHILLKDIILSQLLSDNFLPRILHTPTTKSIPAVLPIIKAMILIAISSTTSRRIGNVEINWVERKVLLSLIRWK